MVVFPCQPRSCHGCDNHQDTQDSRDGVRCDHEPWCGVDDGGGSVIGLCHPKSCKKEDQNVVKLLLRLSGGRSNNSGDHSTTIFNFTDYNTLICSVCLSVCLSTYTYKNNVFRYIHYVLVIIVLMLIHVFFSRDNHFYNISQIWLILMSIYS